MERLEKRILDDKVVVGVVFIITAIIFVTAFAFMIAANSYDRNVSSELRLFEEVSSNYEAPWIHPSRHN